MKRSSFSLVNSPFNSVDNSPFNAVVVGSAFDSVVVNSAFNSVVNSAFNSVVVDSGFHSVFKSVDFAFSSFFFLSSRVDFLSRTALKKKENKEKKINRFPFNLTFLSIISLFVYFFYLLSASSHFYKR